MNNEIRRVGGVFGTHQSAAWWVPKTPPTLRIVNCSFFIVHFFQLNARSVQWQRERIPLPPSVDGPDGRATIGSVRDRYLPRQRTGRPEAQQDQLRGQIA